MPLLDTMKELDVGKVGRAPKDDCGAVGIGLEK